VFDVNGVESLPVSVDDAGEIDLQGRMIKGCGAALPRERRSPNFEQGDK